jgi:hypothetical protein
MSNPISPEDLKDIEDSIFAGRKIEAIKLYRKYSGLGLKEAKDAVEETEKKLRAESPGKFLLDEVEQGKHQRSNPSVPGVQVGKGCFGMFAAVLLIATIVILLHAILGH